MPTCSAPAVTRTASGFQSVKALTGPPDHERQDRQWQYPMPSGSPEASICTAPQKHSPLCVAIALLMDIPSHDKPSRSWLARVPRAGKRSPQAPAVSWQLHPADKESSTPVACSASYTHSSLTVRAL